MGGGTVKLYELLGVGPGVTALIGGGGKTTAMYTLAEELRQRGTVLCCTTTRIFPPDHLPVLARPTEAELRRALERHGCVCAGTPAEQGKLAPPELPMARLAALADYVLAEADGSKGLPLKAHLFHEPVIPPEAARTVLLLGASGFGRPVREAVHRPERFCQLTGADMDQPVTPSLAALAVRAEGLGDVVFVNQAETEQQMALAKELASRLACPVCAGALRKGEWLCLS